MTFQTNRRAASMDASSTKQDGPTAVSGEPGHACYVVCLALHRETVSHGQVQEILSLVRAQGDRVVGHEVIQVADPDARTLMKKGACEALAERARSAGADLLVFDADVSPSQNRNLEALTELSITDREAIILNVFLRNARTKSARMQVEISQLEYLRPRIRGLGLQMDQQAGGLTNARGPGETASELLARRLDGRLADLKRALAKLEQASAARRKRRDGCRRVVLVGYTNAGKTSLMNALTGTALSSKDQPFETLDTTSRNLTRYGGDVLVSDTVGFIRRLPDRLLTSFESTLSEIHEASLLVIVVDASDPEHPLHLQTTDRLLNKLGAAEVRRFYVFNKADRLKGPGPTLSALSRGHPFRFVSSFDSGAVARLASALIQAARGGPSIGKFFVPYEATEAAGLISARCRIIDARPAERGMRYRVEAEPATLARVEKALGAYRGSST